jgi:hypothetical protein
MPPRQQSQTEIAKKLPFGSDNYAVRPYGAFTMPLGSRVYAISRMDDLKTERGRSGARLSFSRMAGGSL